MKKLLLATLLLIVSLSISAQRYISGHITDAEFGDSIPGVSVFIANTTIGTVSDENGYYKLAIPGPGSYRLTAAHAGHQNMFIDIEPGNHSVVNDIKMKIQELAEVSIVKKVKFRSEDIDLFWKTILGKYPSKYTIQAINSKAPFFNYNSKTNILNAYCYEPLLIINKETGYLIHYVLKEFTHDYNTNLTYWEGEYRFEELAPKNFKEENSWEKNRKKVYSVSITNFIRSLYSNSLLKNGFSFYKLEVQTFNQRDGKWEMSVLEPVYSFDMENYLFFNKSESFKTICIPSDSALMLACFGRPIYKIKPYKLYNPAIIWQIGLFRSELHTNGDSIRIFPDGTFTNKLSFSSNKYFSAPITGLNMMLPLDYASGIDYGTITPAADTDSIAENESGGEVTDRLADSLYNAAKRFDIQLGLFPQEKIYLHTDKPYYISGERIWFRAHVVDAASHIPNIFANSVFAELFDARDSVISRVKIGWENDMFSGYIPVPEDTPEGDYTVRAYTNTMRGLDEDYFFMKNIRIANPATNMNAIQTSPKNKKLPLPDNDFDVSFYPEGGYALTGCPGRIAFKAMQSNGTELNVTGIVYDRQGNEIRQFKTDVCGMGQFWMTPEKGERYYAVCANDKGQSKRFELPEAQENGYSLTAAWRKDGYLAVKALLPESPKTGDSLCLIVHTRGIVQDIRVIKDTGKELYFRKDLFPSGVSCLLLLTKDMIPLSERLVFVNNNDQATAAGKADKETYTTRDPVRYTINVTGESGEPLQGNFSVSVTDDREVAVDTASNILTSLLLTSDLRGNIADPAFYFHKNTQSELAADLLMLTQGWRRYDTERMLKNDFMLPDTLLEKESGISGTVKSIFSGKPAENAKVNMFSTNGAYFDETSTDRNGRFYLTAGEAPDSIRFIVQAMTQSGKIDNNFELTVNKSGYPARHIPAVPSQLPEQSIFAKYVEKAEQQYIYEHGRRVVQLNEVTVNAKRQAPRRSSYYISPDASLTEEQINRLHPENLKILLMRLPGVYFKGDSAYIAHGINGKVTYLVDDVPETAIEWLDVSDVAHVDLLTSPTALTHFPNGGSGVIAIYTKTGNRTSIKRPYLKTIIPLGFQTPVEFYTPKYNLPEQNTMPDLRTTIHWQPSLTTDETGTASFSFYTADAPSTYSIVIEGVTDNGKIIYKRDKIVVGETK